MVSFKGSGTDPEKLLQNLKLCHLESSKLLLSLLTGESNQKPLHNTTNEKTRNPRSHLQSIKPTAGALCNTLLVMQEEIIGVPRC